MRAWTYGMSRSPPATPTRAPQCATTGPAQTWTATPTTSSPPTWHRPLDRASCLLRLMPQERHGVARVHSVVGVAGSLAAAGPLVTGIPGGPTAGRLG